jgi:hypothetical protein
LCARQHSAVLSAAAATATSSSVPSDIFFVFLSRAQQKKIPYSPI